MNSVSACRYGLEALTPPPRVATVLAVIMG
jgi:hypothetical protein